MADARSIILQRRARFIAASLAAASLTAVAPAAADGGLEDDASVDGGDSGVLDASSDAPPQPCLSSCASMPGEAPAGGAAAMTAATLGALAARRKRKR